MIGVRPRVCAGSATAGKLLSDRRRRSPGRLVSSHALPPFSRSQAAALSPLSHTPARGLHRHAEAAARPVKLQRPFPLRGPSAFRLPVRAPSGFSPPCRKAPMGGAANGKEKYVEQGVWVEHQAIRRLRLSGHRDRRSGHRRRRCSCYTPKASWARCRCPRMDSQAGEGDAGRPITGHGIQ